MSEEHKLIFDYNNLSERDNRKKKQLMLFYCITFFGNGIYGSFFSTYETILETDVYMFPVMLIGIIEVLSQIVKWVFSPLFGAFMDRFSFKKGKFWPWMQIGVTLMLVSHGMFFILPTVIKNATTVPMIALVFLLQCCTSFAAPMYTTAVNSVYPKISLQSEDRSLMAMGQKVGRDSSKMLFGFLVPILIVFFTNRLGSEANAYALLAVVFGLMAFSPYLALSFGLRDSYVEKNAAAEAITFKKKHNGKMFSFKVMYEALLQNRSLAGIFVYMILTQAAGFLVQFVSIYLFKYYYHAFAYHGIFTSAYNMAAVGGVVVGVLWRKYLKDTKKAFVSAGCAQILGLVGLVFAVNTGVWWLFVIAAAVENFFFGMCEAYYLPMFGIAADYATYKTGQRQDALIMSFYTMSVSIGLNLQTLIKSFLLTRCGYDAKAYAAGAEPTELVLKTLRSMNALIPLILTVLGVLVIYFVCDINEKKHDEIIRELSRREVESEQDLSEYVDGDD